MEGIMESILETISASGFSLNFASSGMGILAYILQAIALYTIATRREIKHPWMAWVPILNVWILGSISDQYRYVVKRQIKNKRKVLLGLNIATTVLVIFLVVFVLVTIFSGLLSMEAMPEYIDPTLEEMSFVETEEFRDMVGALLVVVLAAIPLMILGIVSTVFFYMALYDIFCSCEPANSTLYLVLSVVGSVILSGAHSLFLVLCREKDLGMPPRKDRPQPEVVVEPAAGYDPWSDTPRTPPRRPTTNDPWEN